MEIDIFAVRTAIVAGEKQQVVGELIGSAASFAEAAAIEAAFGGPTVRKQLGIAPASGKGAQL